MDALVAILGLVLFFIIFLFIASLAEAAYYLFP
jgi:lipopolysaccharide/colanic/teichoic acid biosynthesis glycosyltransferase